ncbi:MAG: hypothetical protein Q9201_006974 [Fulgogasparrea decipioides]
MVFVDVQEVNGLGFGHFPDQDQASTNHQAIANAVADSIDELSQDIAYWNSWIRGSQDSKAVCRYIRELYVVVFEFLTEIFTNWSRSSWKRFLTSFDERAFDKLFTERKGRIRAIEQRMFRFTNLEFQKGVTDRMSRLEAGLQMMFDSQTCSELDQRNLLLELGANMQQLFDQQTRQQCYALEAAPAPTLSTENLVHTRVSESQSPVIDGLDYDNHFEKLHRHEKAPDILRNTDHHRSTFLKALEALSAKFGEELESILAVIARVSHIKTDSQVRNRLENWNQDPHPKSLWIQGPYDVPKPSQNTLTAVCLVALSRKSDIPCVFYFCTLEASHQRMSRRETLMAIAKSLILQMVLLLPHEFTTDVDIPFEHLDRLVKDTINFAEAMNLLFELRKVASPYLHVVLDGLEVLEDRSDMEQMRDLKNLLDRLSAMDKGTSADGVRSGQAVTRLAGSTTAETLPIREPRTLPRITKVAVTTDGYVDTLARLVNEHCLDKVEFLNEADEPGADESVDFMA